MMEFLLLGTGSADGWPNPWCTCGSCTWARVTGTHRARTSALVDSRILIDPGPDLTTRMAAAGRDLAGVELVLVTHAHHDHLDPSFPLSRSWGHPWGGAGPGALTVAGPPSAIAALREWVGPDSPVLLQEMVAGQVLRHGGTVVRALPAAHSLAGGHVHDGTALLYEVNDPRGTILWATDTAHLPHADLAGPYDLVALEETFGDVVGHATAHLGIAGFTAEVERLRTSGLLGPHGVVVAVHLSHHNPPDVAARLAGCGALVLPDLTSLQVGAHPAVPPDHTLVTGGARSGKSRRAEDLARATGRQVVYVATAPGYPEDPEWVARVAAHRDRRPPEWLVRETAEVAGQVRSAGSDQVLLVDCLALWVTGLVDRVDGWGDARAARAAVDAALGELLAALASARCPVILVTNEVGSGVVPATASGRMFQDLLGTVNAAVAGACHQVELMVCGVPLATTRRTGTGAARPVTHEQGAGHDR